MGEKKSLRSRAFLIELLLMILFFAFISSVTLRVFVQGYKLREETRDLTFANMQLQSMAEYIKGSKNKEDLEGLLTQVGAIKKGDSYIVSYEDKKYEVVLKLSEERRGKGKMLYGEIVVYKTSSNGYKAIDSLVIQKYYRGKEPGK